MRIADLLERDVHCHAERTAVAVVDGGTWTYRELWERVRRIASGLSARGIGRGDRVALLADNGISYFDTFLAAACLGAAAVPVNTTLTPAEAGYILGHAEPALVLVDGPHRHLAETAGTVPVINVASPEYRALVTHEIVESALHGATEDDTAVLMYTSGTTGRPKGVRLSQRAMTSNALTLAVAQQLTPDDVFLTTTPLYHAATGTRVVSMLVDGQTHVVLPKFEVTRFLHTLADYRVTTTVLVPTQLRRMLDSPTLDEVELSALRLLVYGAAPTAQDVIRRARDRLDCGLYQGYGLTEAVTNLTALSPNDHARADETLLGSCGKPVPGVLISLRDGSGREVPNGEVGEICVRTDKLMTGYWRDPAATDEVLVGGWLHTGDLAHRDAHGYLYVAGRSKDMLISGGVNVYPAEIEAVLHTHDAVLESAVVGLDSPEWGQVPVAFVVPRPEMSIDPGDLRTWSGARLARAKVPARVEIVTELPRTASGKVRKTELRDRMGTGDGAR